MQPKLYCATCTAPLAFKVPGLKDDRWHTRCPACGEATAPETNLNEREEPATFNLAVAGVYPFF